MFSLLQGWQVAVCRQGRKIGWRATGTRIVMSSSPYKYKGIIHSLLTLNYFPCQKEVSCRAGVIYGAVGKPPRQLSKCLTCSIKLYRNCADCSGVAASIFNGVMSLRCAQSIFSHAGSYCLNDSDETMQELARGILLKINSDRLIDMSSSVPVIFPAAIFNGSLLWICNH